MSYFFTNEVKEKANRAVTSRIGIINI
jgi:hypothetical protein